jgi:hypothetical protein
MRTAPILKSSSNFRRTSAIANLLIGDVSTLRGETQQVAFSTMTRAWLSVAPGQGRGDGGVGLGVGCLAG